MRTDELSAGGLDFGDAPEGQRLRAIHAYWDGKRRGRLMPSRADIDPLELKPYLPQLVLLDVEGDPPRFRYRLVGAEVTRVRQGLVKSDPTGEFVDAVTHHQGTAAVLAHYRRVVAERKPSTDAGVYVPSRERPGSVSRVWSWSSVAVTQYCTRPLVLFDLLSQPRPDHRRCAFK
jgi:hypothetical protein